MKFYKKPSLTVLCFITLFTISYGQGNYFALKGGVNLVTQRFSGDGVGTSSSPDRALKPHFGILYNAMLSDVLAIQPELHYSGHGFEPVDNPVVDKIDFNYIALPVMLKYYFNSTVNIHGGPELSYLIGGTEVNGQSITDETTDANLALAIGLEIFLFPNVGLSGRYVGGITDIDTVSDLIDQKTNNLQFSVVLSFN